MYFYNVFLQFITMYFQRDSFTMFLRLHPDDLQRDSFTIFFTGSGASRVQFWGPKFEEKNCGKKLRFWMKFEQSPDLKSGMCGAR